MFEDREEEERFNEQQEFEKAQEHEAQASAEAETLANIPGIAELSDINGLVFNLRDLRKAKEFIEATVELARVKWEESNAGILQDQAQIRAKLMEVEIQLRERALQAYANTKDRHPAIGVEIKTFLELKYDPKLALEWAKTHDLALILDHVEFQKLAKIKKPDFVQTLEVPKAQISRNLEAVIKTHELKLIEP